MAVTDKQKQNLKPMQPGETRNPNGRPKGSLNRATNLKKFLAIKQKKQANPLKPGTETTFTVAELIDLKLIQLALGGDMKAIQMVQETMFGKIAQEVNLGGQLDNPIISEEKITKLTPLQLLVIKYGADSEEVSKFKELYPDT